VNSEEDVFYALMAWINHDKTARISYIDKLLPLVKISQLSPTFITDNIECLCDTIETQKMLLNAYKFQLMPERRDLLSDHAIPRKSTVGKLLCIGGMDNQKSNESRIIECYDLREDKWDFCKSMPTR
jgi:hypothetical protein